MKTIKQSIFLITAIFLFAATSCIDEYQVNGNGIEAIETRLASEFTRVQSDGSFEVHISYGNEFEVLVSAEENIIEHIYTQVSNEVLIIDNKRMLNIKNSLPMKVFITMPAIKSIKLKGTGNVTSDFISEDKIDIVLSGSGKITTAFNGNKANIDLSGSGEIELSGTVNHTNIRLSGSGSIEAQNLSSIDCQTLTIGSGDIWISVDRFLEATISGSGDVYYYGEPVLDAQISGSGNVRNLKE